MKKSIMGVLALLWVSMIVLGGCSSPKVKIFSLESPQKITVTSISGEKIEVTDEDIIQQITDNITSIQFEKGESSEDTNGFGPIISWYNSNGDVIETISVMSNDTIIYNNYFWTVINGSIDMEVINATLSTDTGENIAIDGVADYPAAIRVLLCLQKLMKAQLLDIPSHIQILFQKIAGRLILILNWECHMHRWRAE